MLIRLGQDGDLTLQFKIRSTPVAELWVERMQARGSYPLDHPDRFYGFGTPAQEQTRAVEYIQSCIAIINSHEVIIHRPFEYTQDCLNYLHNIFERYHGLLDQQNTDYWNRAPDKVRRALAELNLAVHRCETATEGTKPRLVCEIGKTVEDLANDNDKYIGDDAFRPFGYYSADFNVQFHDQDLTERYGKVQQYIDQHSDFFLAYNITNVYNTQAQPQRFPVADLIYTGNRDQLLADIAVRQWVQQATIE